MLYNIRYWWFFLCQGNWWTKYRDQNLACWCLCFGHFGRLSLAAVHSADCWFNSGVTWWIHVSSIVPYLHKNSFLLHRNSCKQHSESSTHCFWSTVSKCSVHFKHSFLIDKCSCKMVNTLPSDIFNSSTISCNFNLRSAKRSLWSFWCLPGQLLNLGVLCSASFLSVRPRLKSTCHLLTIVSDRAESE